MNPKQTATIGHNRTGVGASEGRAEAMQRDAEQFPPSSHGSAAGPDKVRVLYARQAHALGSVPPATGVKGEEPTLLMDKLGERLAFERTGTRLYEALVSKHEASGGFAGGPSRLDLIEILNQEHAHFAMLEQTMKDMGGDPTAVTPSADLAATATSGVMKIIVDPRTTLLQGLEAILIAELADNASWEELTQIAEQAGKSELADNARRAHQTEEQHLAKVKAWIRSGVRD